MYNIEIKEQDTAAILVLSGEVDSRSTPDIQKQVLPVLEKHHRIVMDLTGLTFLSSAGLRMLLLLYRHTTAASGKVVLVGVPANVHDTMAATGFLSFFTLTETMEAALQAVRT